MSSSLLGGSLNPQARGFLILLGRRMVIIAAVWIALYFSTQWMATGVPALFAPMVGAIAGFFFGWCMAENAVDESELSGAGLWAILIGAVWLAMWIPEGLLGTITGWGIGGFGRWMLILFAMLLSLAAALWRASVDE